MRVRVLVPTGMFLTLALYPAFLLWVLRMERSLGISWKNSAPRLEKTG